MSEVYKEEPVTVAITLSDPSRTETRYVTGLSLETVLAAVEGALHAAEPGKPKKERKKRAPKAKAAPKLDDLPEKFPPEHTPEAKPEETPAQSGGKRKVWAE